MDADELLRTYALEDLKRFCPPAHYLGRDYSLEADRELAEPLVLRPMQFGLTPRERMAAEALRSRAIFELRNRAIFSEAFPVRDSGDMSEPKGMSRDQELQLVGLREVFRRKALMYARATADAQLIEAFAAAPAVQPAEDAEPEEEHGLSIEPLASNPDQPTLTTGEIAFAFRDVHFAQEAWKRNLEDCPNWLIDHRVLPGATGGDSHRQAIWDAFGIARALVITKRLRKRGEYLNQLRLRFNSEPLLTPFRRAWEEFLEDQYG